MARQFAVGRADTGRRSQIGHGHCEVCGACYIAGVTETNHRCPAPVDSKILEVYVADVERHIARPTTVPDGFQAV